MSETGLVQERFRDVRQTTLSIAERLSDEDQAIQSMADVSPTKWHLAHTTWFFETFLLRDFVGSYRPFDDRFHYLFNSYYEAEGPRHARPERGLLSRPKLSDIHAYRDHVDAAMFDLIEGLEGAEAQAALSGLLELGLNHEQQHQELVLTDIKHVLSCNPLLPAYVPHSANRPREAPPLQWHRFEGGLVEIGFNGDEFCFDNEKPRHKVWLEDFRMASRPTTNAEFIEFIEDGGYRDPRLWLSDGWHIVQAEQWLSPLYWYRKDGHWFYHTLTGPRMVDPSEPVAHASYFEADAFATWAGGRLPIEAEWELAAEKIQGNGNFLDGGYYHPQPASSPDGLQQMLGDVWEWTSSAYSSYPGYKVADGAVGEYNGKFMINQMVLRGGSCVTPPGHIRTTYRNFFHPHQRWQFSGFRLAGDDA